MAGNLKFDVRAAQQAEATRLLQSLAPGLRVVVAGSTLDGEEAVLLDAWPQLLAIDPKLLLVLAPRHPERFAAVASLLERTGVRWIKRSAWKSIPQDAIQPIQAGQVILLDTIGELASIYSLAAGSIHWRQPDSGRRPQPVGASPVRCAHRDRSELRQLPRHYRRPARSRCHSHRLERGTGWSPNRSVTRQGRSCRDGSAEPSKFSIIRPARQLLHGAGTRKHFAPRGCSRMKRPWLCCSSYRSTLRATRGATSGSSAAGSGLDTCVGRS